MPTSRVAEIEAVEPLARDVLFDEDRITVELVDGRAISVPLAFYPRLFNGTPEQRSRWRLIGAGHGIHWPDLDEDLSTEGLLRGARALGGRTA